MIPVCSSCLWARRNRSPTRRLPSGARAGSHDLLLQLSSCRPSVLPDRPLTVSVRPSIPHCLRTEPSALRPAASSSSRPAGVRLPPCGREAAGLPKGIDTARNLRLAGKRSRHRRFKTCESCAASATQPRHGDGVEARYCRRAPLEPCYSGVAGAFMTRTSRSRTPRPAGRTETGLKSIASIRSA